MRGNSNSSSSYTDVWVQDTVENGIRPYTIRSHGIKVARKHLLDWLILVVLVVTEIILNVITPFHRYVGKDIIDDLKYPLKSSTVPFWAVPLYAVVLPIIVFILRYLRRRDVHDLHHAILGLLYAILITGVITDTVKDAVGRPRPDFFWRCFPDGQDKYDNLGNVICNGDPSVIKEGYKSFPSGHASWSFAGLGYLALYMTGKIQVFDTRGRIASLCLVLLPLLVATLVAISRVDDYVHQWTDVFAGSLIGLVSCFLCYLLFFPLPYRNKGWGSYSYFVALEEDTREADGTPMNVVNVAVAESSDIFTPTKHDEKDHKITING